MQDHALLSPSNASHWKECAAGAYYSTLLISKSSEYAARGALLHNETYEALKNGVEPESDEVKLIVDSVKSFEGKESQVFLEQRIEFGDILDVEDKYAFGTSDYASLDGDLLTVLDFKFGSQFVDAIQNYQLALYALGFAKMLGRKDLNFQMGILSILNGEVQQNFWRLSYEDTYNFVRENLLKQAHHIVDIYEGRTPLTVEDFGDNCQFCQAQGVYNLKQNDLAKKVVSGWYKEADLSICLDILPELKKFIKSIETQALEKLTGGGKIENYELTYGNKKALKWRGDDAKEIEQFLPGIKVSETVLRTPLAIIKELQEMGHKRKDVELQLQEITYREESNLVVKRVKRNEQII